MITDMFTINLGQLCAHARRCVHVFEIFVMTGRNISNDSDKGASVRLALIRE